MTSESAIIPDDNMQSRRVVRVLSSELDAEVREPLHAFVREAIGNEVWLETLLVENPLDSELLRTAVEHHWDLAILILDRIKYPSNDPAAIVRGAIKLLKGLRKSSKDPLICFYSWMDDSELPKAALAAGADDVFRLPCKSADVVPTLKRALKTFVPPPAPPPLPGDSPSATPLSATPIPASPSASDADSDDSSERKSPVMRKPWELNPDDV